MTDYNRVSYTVGFPQRYVDEFQTIIQQTDLSNPLNASSQKDADRFFANTKTQDNLQDAACALFSNGFSHFGTNMVSPNIQASFDCGVDCVKVCCLNNYWTILFYIQPLTINRPSSAATTPATDCSQTLDDITF